MFIKEKHNLIYNLIMWTILYMVIFHLNKISIDHLLWYKIGFIALYGISLARQVYKVYKEKETNEVNKSHTK